MRLDRRIAAGLLGSADTAALRGPDATLPLAGLAEGVGGLPAEAIRGRSVLLRTRDPLAAAAGLCRLDGRARRLALCPPDVAGEGLAAAARAIEAEVVATDDPDAPDLPPLPRLLLRLEEPPGAPGGDGAEVDTQWALFTSGTSGAPKLVSHTLAGLTDAIAPQAAGEPAPVWATFYDIRRYGGLQMLLRALLGGFSLHLAGPDEPPARFLERVRGATHVAGTPSHWRRALMSPALARLDPAYLRLSGEIADQAILDALRARFPRARIGHAYASTEAGVGFEVGDGREGFPAALVEDEAGPVRMRVVDDVLQLRSARTAGGYLGETAPALSDADGWVDTGDRVERRGARFHFLGRRSGVINVGGLKISPEEVEAVINACPAVRVSRVAGRASPLLGALVTAEVVLEAGADPSAARTDILARCRAALPPHKAPASLRVVEALAIGAAGKLERARA